MPTFVIGPFTYPTKTEATEAVRSVLHNAPLGVPLQGSDLALISALVDLHPAAAEKIGPGIDRITVEIIEMGSRGFWIYRTDGTSTDFSYRKALSKPSHENEVKGAMRRAVADQILEFRDSVFSDSERVGCPVTGHLLTKQEGHVDHVIPFSALVKAFMTGWKLSYDDITLIPSVDREIGRRLPPDLERQWVDFHRLAAKLRFVHPAANRRRGAA